MALRKKSPSPQDDTIVPLHPNAEAQEPELVVDDEFLDAAYDEALDAAGFDTTVIPPPDGKHLSGITAGSIATTTNQGGGAVLVFSCAVKNGEKYEGRPIDIRIEVREAHSFRIEQSQKLLKQWLAALRIGPKELRGLKPLDIGKLLYEREPDEGVDLTLLTRNGYRNVIAVERVKK